MGSLSPLGQQDAPLHTCEIIKEEINVMNVISNQTQAAIGLGLGWYWVSWTWYPIVPLVKQEAPLHTCEIRNYVVKEYQI